MTNPADPLAITPAEATEFYRVLGRALWALGAFEHFLAYYLVIVLKSSFASMEAAEQELNSAFSLTLGNLLREFRKQQELAPDLDKRLSAFKLERDWLCHRIYRQHHTDLLNRPRFQILLQRIVKFKAEAGALTEVFDRSFDQWCTANGITEKELAESVNQTFVSWKQS